MNDDSILQIISSEIDPSLLGEDEIKNLSLYTEKIVGAGFPIIYDHFHLSKYTNIESDWLTKIVGMPEKFYREFSIPKRSGGFRTISAPYPMLLSIQQWVLSNILYKINVSDYSHGFVKDKSIISNAQIHLDQKYVLKVDIKNFFPSIGINRVYRIFQRIGYSNTVCFFLARICCLNGCLPQGSATSPCISNIIFKRADHRLYGLAKKFGLGYSRYADDITFSGDYISPRFISLVRKIITNEGFKINEKKLRRLNQSSQKIVTGLVVSGEELKLTKKYKRDTRQRMYYIEKYGFLSAINKQDENNPLYLEQMMGKLNFWLQVENDNKYALRAIKIIRDQMVRLKNL